MRRFAVVPALLLTAAAVCLVPVAASAVVTTQASAVASVTLYSGKGYSGTTTTFASGDVVPDLGQRLTAAASSIAIPTGTDVAVYSNADFRGTCVDVQRSIGDLSTTALGSDIALSLVVGEGCQALATSASSAAGVVLCADAGCPSGDTTVKLTRDVPELGATGFADQASSVQLTGGLYAAALYTGADYTGHCETIATPQLDLTERGGSLVDNDTISSVRLNATCFGPVTSAPAVSQLEFRSSATDDVTCQDGWTKDGQDLNESAGGSFIYTCVKYTPYAVGNTYVDDLFYYNDLSPSSCNSNRSGYEQSDDLNAGAGGDYVYACWHRSTVASASAANAVVDTLWYAYDQTSGSGSANAQSVCDSEAQSKVAGAIGSGDVITSARDINSDVIGSSSIYGCVDRPTRSASSAAPVVTAPANLTTLGNSVSFHAHGAAVDGTALPLNCDGISSGTTGTRAGDLYAMTYAGTGSFDITCSVTDPNSGLTSSTTFPVTVTAYDHTAPVITASAATASGAYSADTWTNQPVTVSFTCTDPGSDSQGIEVAAVPSITVDTQTPAAGTTVTSAGQCKDNAGNSATPVSFGTVKLDTTAPAAGITTPTEDALVTEDSDVSLQLVCSDALSGIRSCGLSPDRLTLDTSTLGEKSVTLTATDIAGNSSVVTRHYRVVSASESAPVFVAGVSTTTVAYSDKVHLSVSATDPDSDALTLRATGLPAGVELVDAGDGTATIDGATTARPGSYDVTVTADDGRGGVATEHIVIGVKAEKAIVSLAAANPRSVGSRHHRLTSTVVLRGRLVDVNDTMPGSIRLATPHLKLARVAKNGKPGATVNCARTKVTRVTKSVTIACTVPTRIRPATYRVTVSATGYYTGSATGKLVVRRR